MDFEIIYELDKEAFHIFGGIYLYRSIKNKDDRDRQRQIDSMEDKDSKNLSVLGYGSYEVAANAAIGSVLSSESASRALFQQRMHSMYNELLNDDVDGYDINSIQNQKDKLLDEVVTGDEYIIIPRSGFVGNDLVDLENSSMMVIRLNEDIHLGFIVDKAVIEIIGYNTFKGTKEE